MFELDWNSFLAGAAFMGIIASFDSKSKPGKPALVAFLPFMVVFLYRFVSDGYDIGQFFMALLFARLSWLALTSTSKNGDSF